MAWIQDTASPATHWTWALLVTNGGEQWFVVKKGSKVYYPEAENVNEQNLTLTISGQVYNRDTASWLETLMDGADLIYLSITAGELTSITNDIANMRGYSFPYVNIRGDV